MVVTQDRTKVTGDGFSGIFLLAREEPVVHNLSYLHE